MSFYTDAQKPAGLKVWLVLILLHPLSTSYGRRGLHSLRNHPGTIISATLSLQNLKNYPVLPHHRRTQSKIVKCINKAADKSSHRLFVNLINNKDLCACYS
uniref:Secreted protein n=1 Tax=Junco hyemalis TaxID=40217 RepID=A0A8C5JD76_JUNHY